MPHSIDVPRGPVRARFSFYEPPADGAKPFNYTYTPPPDGHPQRNFGENVQDVQLADIRGHESDYSLDRDAFAPLQGIQSSATHATFDNDDEVRRVYYPEVEKLLLEKVPGNPYRVIIFDHTIRRPQGEREPVNRAHADQTAKAAAERVKLHVPEQDEVGRLLAGGGRYRIINVWRPINGTVVSSPLALAQASSVDPKRDLVPVEHRYRHRTGETFSVRYNEGQHWLYWSGMEDDERLLLECSDTKPGVPGRVPHSAFTDPRTPQGAKGRESIEVRALVLG